MTVSMTLADADRGAPLRILAIGGGHGVRQRLFALGFHVGDLVELNSHGILHGPVLVRNLTTDTSVALGRGIAQKIEVQAADVS